jgi:hypothetical protein
MTQAPLKPPTNGQPQTNAKDVPVEGISVASPVVEGGFKVPAIKFHQIDGTESLDVPTPPAEKSQLSSKPAVAEAELLELSADTGRLLYYPPAISLDPGDVLYLRERSNPQGENGLIVQIITKETATYAQVESKVTWRLLTAVRAHELRRTHHEPTEVIDLFLAATFKVRAVIKDGTWKPAAGEIVTRNVDIFWIDPKILMNNILDRRPGTDLSIGEFKGEPVAFAGRGTDKINLVTGMKGAGKSHLTKGIIDQARQRGVSAVVFDINDEYGRLPGAMVFRPGGNLKFRLDRTETRSFIDVINRLAPFAERTQYPAIAGLYKVFEQRVAKAQPIDISFLKKQVDIVLPGDSTYIKNQRDSYVQTLDTIDSYNLFMSENDTRVEDDSIKKRETPVVASLKSAFAGIDQQQQAGVVVFSIGGMLPIVQRIIVKLVRDALKEICDRQTARQQKDPSHVPIYPAVFFEEAHMYMDEQDINELIPVIRHLGMNLFFVTNTPGALLTLCLDCLTIYS